MWSTSDDFFQRNNGVYLWNSTWNCSRLKQTRFGTLPCGIKGIILHFKEARSWEKWPLEFALSRISYNHWPSKEPFDFCPSAQQSVSFDSIFMESFHGELTLARVNLKDEQHHSLLHFPDINKRNLFVKIPQYLIHLTLSFRRQVACILALVLLWEAFNWPLK